MDRSGFEEKYRRWQKGAQERSEASARRREQRNDIANKLGSIFLVIALFILGVLDIMERFL